MPFLVACFQRHKNGEKPKYQRKCHFGAHWVPLTMQWNNDKIQSIFKEGEREDHEKK